MDRRNDKERSAQETVDDSSTMDDSSTIRELRHDVMANGRRRAYRRKSMTRPLNLCICLVLALVDYSAVNAQTPTPAPIRIPETIPPVPTTTPPPMTPPPVVAASPAPTGTPTAAPPTKSPTVPPTTSPPSKAPTASPTSSPTAVPTAAPTAFPTVSPTAPPTQAPTQSPTIAPSDAPSLAPSQETASPTESPQPTTQSPTTMPSALPSYAPSPLPSASPTNVPSSSPTASPTLSLQNFSVEGIDMFFDNCQELVGQSENNFQRVTANHIEAEMMESADPPMYGLSVGTNIRKQTMPKETSRSVPPTVRRMRVLQAAASPLKIVFDTAGDYRSTSMDHNVPELIGGAFDTDEDKQEYIRSLQATGDPAFADITDVRVEINGIEQGGGDDDDDAKKQDDDILLYVIIGASAGGGVLVLLTAGFIFYRLRRRRKGGKGGKNVHTAAPTTPSVNGQPIYSTEIQFDHQDDISTLGDPMYAPGGMLIPGLEKDETVAGASFGDYEYTKTYGTEKAPESSVASETVSKRTGSDRELSALDIMGQDSIFSDDSSFEEQYKAEGENLINVVAPGGKLGMVIDTPSGGLPMVHAIKDTSVLANQVKVGDRLLSVDGQDCSCMTAMQVSKLISQKADNPSRVLVFSRARQRILSA